MVRNVAEIGQLLTKFSWNSVHRFEPENDERKKLIAIAIPVLARTQDIRASIKGKAAAPNNAKAGLAGKCQAKGFHQVCGIIRVPPKRVVAPAWHDKYTI